MDSQERFLSTMRFEEGARPNKWEFGYWASTIERWYKEGLPRVSYPVVPANIVNSTSSLYTAVWRQEWLRGRSLFELVFTQPEHDIPLPKGMPVVGGGIYWPTQGLPIDSDVRRHFGLDQTQTTVSVEQLVFPHFEVGVLREDEETLDYVDIDGCVRRYSKTDQVIPAGIEWPVKNSSDWEDYKRGHMSLDRISERLPLNWDTLTREYRNRTYPLTLGGYPNGLFGTLTHLMGYEHLFIGFYDQPKLIKAMLHHISEIWIAVWEQVLYDTDVDMCHFWEDISFGKGSMISLVIFKEFLMPVYQRLTGFLASKGIDIILVDTDGDCRELIPAFLESGVTGLYPMEANCGMDVVEVRKAFPDLQIMGGIPKSEIKFGEKRIREILEPVRWLLDQGGYIPYADHLIPPDVGWAEFSLYRNMLNDIIDEPTQGG